LGQRSPAPLSAAGAILFALEDTLRLLFRPFDVRKWAKLGLICLLLGGGTPTAAFQWSLSGLPGDLRLPSLLSRVRQFMEQHPSLIVLAVVGALALGFGVLYLRSLFRFVLVDSLVNREVSIGRAWFSLRPLGESYFRWLASTLAGLVAAFTALVILTLPGLQAASSSGPGRLFATAAMALILSLIVLVGLGVALLITLSDDLVVPLMYADRLPLPSAWKLLWRKMRADPASFAVYILLRFMLSVGVSVGVLLFLVPLLVGLFSGSIIVTAVVVLALHLVGLTWVWSLPTIGVAILAFLLLAGLLVALLSTVGMPGQVFLQAFSLRFIAARSPSLATLCSLVEMEEEAQ
jgi:hypothetical protein